MNNEALKEEEDSVGADATTRELLYTVADIVAKNEGIKFFTISQNSPIKSSGSISSTETSSENIDEKYVIFSTIKYGKNNYEIKFDRKDSDLRDTGQGKEIVPRNRISSSLQIPYFKNSIRNANISGGIDRIQIGVQQIFKKLQKFSTYKKGWDGEGANPIEWDTVLNVLDFYGQLMLQLRRKKKATPLPFVAPVPDGSIQLEWRTYCKEFTVTMPANGLGKMTFLKVENKMLGEDEEEGSSLSFDEIIDIICDWLLV